MQRSWRALVVDDEPLARDGIEARLRDIEGFEVVGCCGTGAAAVAAIRTLAPDLVFLDVEMPGMTGFDVIAEIGPEDMPAVVFVTAFDHYALKAFDSRAIDYVLKPIDTARFDEAVSRAGARLVEVELGEVGRKLSDLLAAVKSGPPINGDGAMRGQLVLHDGNRVVVIQHGEVDWVEADGDYARLHTKGRQQMIRVTMNSLEAMLPAKNYVRIHRSTIVNIAFIRELIQQPNREYLVCLRDGKRVRASRTYAAGLRSALGLEN